MTQVGDQAERFPRLPQLAEALKDRFISCTPNGFDTQAATPVVTHQSRRSLQRPTLFSAANRLV